MKKILMVLVLVTVIAAGTAFADHPNGWGIGVVTGYNGGWQGGLGHSNVALSLKIPNIPFFWAIDLHIYSGYMGLGLRGDYYLIDKAIAADIGLHWYLGIGAWVNMWSNVDNFGLALGARLPVGINWQLKLGGPLDALELFLEIAPSLGVQVAPDFHFPAGGWGAGFGVRLWF